MRSVISGLALLLVTMPLLAADPPAGGSSAKPGEIPHKLTTEAAVQRGGIVFQHYCALCHGEKADGNGRAAARPAR
jgi:cytochrome c1